MFFTFVFVLPLEDFRLDGVTDEFGKYFEAFYSV